MAPTLYMYPPSPPVRAVLITAKAIGLDLTLKEVFGLKGETRKPEFIKLNPQHTIPTLVEDDGFVIWDSHAINAYLVSKYAKDDSLYPKDLKKRAVIDQRLHFDTGVVFTRFIQSFKPLHRDGKNSVNEEDKDAVNEVYGFLEAFLGDNQWAAGDSLTIADYSLISSITSSDLLVPIDAEKFPKVTAWVKRVQELPEYEANVEGLNICKGILDGYFARD